MKTIQQNCEALEESAPTKQTGPNPKGVVSLHLSRGRKGQSNDADIDIDIDIDHSSNERTARRNLCGPICCSRGIEQRAFGGQARLLTQTYLKEARRQRCSTLTRCILVDANVLPCKFPNLHSYKYITSRYINLYMRPSVSFGAQKVEACTNWKRKVDNGPRRAARTLPAGSIIQFYGCDSLEQERSEAFVPHPRLLGRGDESLPVVRSAVLVQLARRCRVCHFHRLITHQPDNNTWCN